MGRREALLTARKSPGLESVTETFFLVSRVVAQKPTQLSLLTACPAACRELCRSGGVADVSACRAVRARWWPCTGRSG